MARYAGRKGVLYMSTSGSGTATLVASLSQWSLTNRVDRFEVTSFGDANKTYVQGLADVSGDFAGFYDDANSVNLWTAASSSDGVKLYLYPSADAPSKYAYGPAWVDVSISTEVGNPVRVQGSFAANGAWGFRL